MQASVKFFLSLYLFSFFVSSESLEFLKKHLFAYNAENIDFGLYVQTDKNIYRQGEKLWFKAYLTGDTTLKNEVLFLRLVNEKNQTVIKHEFPLYDIRSHGDFILPDTLTDGAYTLLSYTDKMLNFSPETAFNQQLTISRPPETSLQASVSLVNYHTDAAEKEFGLLIKVSQNGIAASKVNCAYTLTDEYNKAVFKGQLVTNISGLVSVKVDKHYLKAHPNLQLRLDLSRNKVKSTINLTLPTKDKHFNIAYGFGNGNLIKDQPGRITVKLADLNNIPLQGTLTVYKGKSVLTKLKTNGQGLAFFEINPSGDKEAINIVASVGDKKQSVTVNAGILPDGYGLYIEEKNKQYTALIRRTRSREDVVLVLRSRKDIIWSREIQMNSLDSIRVPIELPGNERNLFSLALFTKDGRCLAEKFFLNKIEPDHKVNFDIKNPSKENRIFEVKIKVSDELNNPTNGNFSVSVVSESRLDTSMYSTITDSNLGLTNLKTSQFTSVRDLNDYLLKYNLNVPDWKKILAFSPKGSLNIIKNTAGVWGTIKHKKNKPISYENLTLTTAKGIAIIPVNDRGVFSIPAGLLAGDDDNQNIIILNKSFNHDHTIIIKDYTETFDAGVIKDIHSAIYKKYVTDEPVIKEVSIPGSIGLKTVEIRSSKNNNTIEKIEQDEKNAQRLMCGDLVCNTGVINCDFHGNIGTSPVIGKRYYYNGRYITYKGCISNSALYEEQNNRIWLKLINQPKEFDYHANNEGGSILYWNPNLNTDHNGEITINFPSELAAGKYKIIVQGVSGKGLKPIYGSKTFN